MNGQERTHLDLFSGIGGFALAARWAGYQTIAFCEQDRFCQGVLDRWWPKVPCVQDVHDLDGNEYKGVTLLTGGFPCTPYSSSGLKRGKEDDRALWPEMVRVVSEARPTWVLGENVAGFVNMGLDDMLSDLEGLGYATQTFCIPACAVNAPHRRNRAWVVAHADRQRGCGGDSPRKDAAHARQPPRRPLAGHWDLEPDVGRVAHGIPNRTHRLAALGNAIVPAVAYEIISAMQ